jgi:hypothetical protein
VNGLLTAGVILWLLAIVVSAVGIMFLAGVVIDWAFTRIRDRHRPQRVTPETLTWLRTTIDPHELELAYLADEAEQRLGRLDQ